MSDRDMVKCYECGAMVPRSRAAYIRVEKMFVPICANCVMKDYQKYQKGKNMRAAIVFGGLIAGFLLLLDALSILFLDIPYDIFLPAVAMAVSFLFLVRGITPLQPSEDLASLSDVCVNDGNPAFALCRTCYRQFCRECFGKGKSLSMTLTCDECSNKILSNIKKNVLYATSITGMLLLIELVRTYISISQNIFPQWHFIIISFLLLVIAFLVMFFVKLLKPGSYIVSQIEKSITFFRENNWNYTPLRYRANKPQPSDSPTY